MKLNGNINTKISGQGAIALNQENGHYLRLNKTSHAILKELTKRVGYNTFTIKTIEHVLHDLYGLEGSYLAGQANQTCSLFRERGLIDD